MADYRGHEIDLKPTAAMARNAARGLAWREEHGRGGTAVGVARARDISNRMELSPETVRRMVSYFARHAVDAEAEGWREGEEGFPSAGRIAWDLWGGDEGKTWAERKDAALDRIDEQEGKAMSQQQRKDVFGQVKALGDRQVRVIASTGTKDRDGDIVVPEGIDLSRYKQNPVVLRQHDHDDPVARCIEIGVSGGRLEALVQFPAEGTSEKADETYKLVKSGVLSAVSIGFIPGEWEPMDSESPYWGGRKYMTCELIEFSFVSVPANPDALVIERGLLSAEAQIALARKNLASMQAQSVDAQHIESRRFSRDEIHLQFAAAPEDVVVDKAAPAAVTKGAEAPNYRSAPMCRSCQHGKTGGCAEYPMPNGWLAEAVCDGWQEMQPDPMPQGGEGMDEDTKAAAARKRMVAAKLKAAGLAA